MSKAFACKTIRSDRVVVETTDGSQSIVVDQALGLALSASGVGKAATITASDDASALVASDGGEIAIRNTAVPMGMTLESGTNAIDIAADRIVVETTDGAQSIIADQSFGLAFSASGTGKAATITASNEASALIASDGGEIAVRNTDVDMGITLDPATNTIAIETPERVIATCQDFVALATHGVAGQADSDVLFSLLRLRNNATLDPANASYAELSNVQVPDLINSSRLNIAPNVASGTSIDSLFTNGGVDNNPGWLLLIQNIGTLPAQTLTLVNQSGSGTAGGLFFGPGDYVIPAGGGVILLFDTHVLAPDGAWLVYGIS